MEKERAKREDVGGSAPTPRRQRVRLLRSVGPWSAGAVVALDLRGWFFGVPDYVIAGTDLMVAKADYRRL